MVKISFVVPAYNEEALLPKCLASIKAELERTPCSAEIIVVNNASTDHTKEAALAFDGVRVVDEPLKGLTRARQAGLEAAQGELLAAIDSDIILPPGWLAKVLQFFEEDPALVAIGGRQRYHDTPRYINGAITAATVVQYVCFMLGLGANLTGGTVVARREVLERIGGYNTSIEFYGEDAEITKRLAKAGKIRFIPKLEVHASGRRLMAEGFFITELRYGLNSLSASLFGKALTTAYTDIRPELKEKQEK